METVIAVYRGQTIANARLIAATSDPDIVADVADQLLSQQDDDTLVDPVAVAFESGRRHALQQIFEEASRA